MYILVPTTNETKPKSYLLVEPHSFRATLGLCLIVILNDGPGTNAGQVSIALTPAPHLDGKYVVFAEVVSGFDVLLEINAMADPERLMKAGGGEGGGGGGGGVSDGSGGGRAAQGGR